MLWCVVALALMTHISFVSLAANILTVFITVTGSVFLALAWARQIRCRALAVLATIVSASIYLAGLWFLGMGLAFYPWSEPDLQVRQGDLVCRAVYYGQNTEIEVFKALPLGLERLQSDYSLSGTPEHIDCKRA